MKNFEPKFFITLLTVILLLLFFAVRSDVKAAKWEQFNECINDYPSDYVCDSCYKVIFKR